MGIEHLLSNKKASFYPSTSPNHTPPYCLPVPVDADDDSQAQGETRPFRNARVMPGLRFTPEEGVYTVMDIVRRATARFGDNAAIASRTKLRTHIRQGPADSNGNKKQLSIPELSEYTITSYRDYETLIAKIGSGLLGLKLRPRHDKLCIWSQTR
jgi:long-chain acyl-CoA synthetase